MATTQLETRTTGVRELFEEADIRYPLLRVGAPSAVPRSIPAGAMAGAMLSWMTGVFAVCYVGLPMLMATIGIRSSLLTDIFFNLPAFVLATMVTVVVACAARPRVRTDVSARRDPVIAAGVGGLIAWAIIHNISWFLRPFADFGGIELLGFVGLNVLEMGLIGMMLASFTRSPLRAFGLGAMFQLLVFGILAGLIAL